VIWQSPELFAVGSQGSYPVSPVIAWNVMGFGRARYRSEMYA